MADFEAWLIFLILVVNVVGGNGKEHLRHRAVSLRQHGFLVSFLVSASPLMEPEKQDWWDTEIRALVSFCVSVFLFGLLCLFRLSRHVNSVLLPRDTL